jgi:hypothetical protein
MTAGGSFLRGVVPGGYPKLLTLVKGGATSIVVPTARIYYLSWYLAYFNTDATVATRTLTISVLLVNSASAILGYRSATASQNAGLSYNVIAGGGLTLPQDVSSGSGMLLPLMAGQTLHVTETNPQAGDTWALEGVYYDTYGIGG